MNEYQVLLKSKMREFAHNTYKQSKYFPKDEVYGYSSQIKRAALSVCLNYIEGYASRKFKSRINFAEIAYGSLQEVRFLLEFIYDEGYIFDKDYMYLEESADEISAMLWKEIKSLETQEKE